MGSDYENLWGLNLSQIEEPVPLSTFIFKIATRCNLDCSYCYVYHSEDQSWKTKPRLMSKEVIDKALFRIFEHVKSHNLSSITIILHGGEPLLAGHELIQYIFKQASDLSKDLCKVELTMQTNGILLNEKIITLFDDYNARIGVSIDGHENANRFRVFHDKKPSYQLVEKAINLLNSCEPGQRVFSSILTVIDIYSDPLEVFKSIERFNPKSIDFLLPYGTHENYPVGKSGFYDTSYADWLIKIFDHWYNQPVFKIRIKYFTNIITLLLGGETETEFLGHPNVNIVTIEANGEIEGVDTLKVAFDGAPSIHKNVFDSSFNEILYAPPILSRMQGLRTLSEVCKKCSLVDVCGGGYLPHRFSVQNGFNNPSVFCYDIAKLICHIRAKILTDLNIEYAKAI